MDRDGLDAQLMAGAMDTQRNFAAVGDQELLNGHGLADNHQRLVELDGLAVARR